MTIAVCWKLVTIGRDGVDSDARWTGVSPADEAALELALQMSDDVVVVCAGPHEAESVLRDALAVGARRVLRIDVSGELDSRRVAQSLANIVQGSEVVLCGDYSLDRGSGSVPAYLAHELGIAQALGLVAVDPVLGVDLHRRVVRRLDGGRREVLAVPTPAVMSVEGSVARLRRAGLSAVVRAKTAEIERASGPSGDPLAAVVVPYRPRARVLPAPTGALLDRVRNILDIGDQGGTHGDAVVLEPGAAARTIADQLVAWGYLSPEIGDADEAG